jgi:hypothetical protein
MKYMVIRNTTTGETTSVFKTNSDLEVTFNGTSGNSYSIRKITEAQFLTLRDILGVTESKELTDSKGIVMV